MGEERVHRRLAAILAADVVGYSRLMGADEEGTLSRLKALRRDLFDPKLNEHRGRIVKTTGDGFLTEFASVIDALRCAIDLQHGMAKCNGEIEPEKRIVLRIGINVGDIVVEAGDIYGDGVNVAARLEALAEPGGICVSGRVQEDARGKLDIAFEDLSEQRLKNIDWPVKVYRVQLGAGSVAPSPISGLPDKPSILVLPLTFASDEEEFRDLGNGLVEDITIELARFTSLMVVARNSSIQYRDTPIELKRVGRELGARYLLAGSIRQLGPQIRITVQLILAETGGHLWAERYDGKLADLLTTQDEIVRSVVTTAEDRIVRSEEHRGLRKPQQSWTAYDYVLQARQCLWDESDDLNAEVPLRRAITLDPSIAEAHALLVFPLMRKYVLGDDDANLKEALESAKKAIALNPQGSGPQFAMALACGIAEGQSERSALHYDRAIALNPNNTYAKMGRAEWLLWGGKAEDALGYLDSAIQQEHFAPAFYWDLRGRILFQLRRYEEALNAICRVTSPQYSGVTYAIAALVHSGQLMEARRRLATLIASQPNVTIARVLKAEVYRDESLRAHLVEGLRKAGMQD
jgi:class 3 adenylate cyclase/TolB-like protein